MKFDVDWLCDHLEGSPDPNALADALTNCGFLVELRERLLGREVWDVEVTTNRPDAMNHRGLAREAAVAISLPLRPLEIEVDDAGSEDVSAVATVEIADPRLATRFAARVVRGVDTVPSPEWMQQRLTSCGVRPISAVVDVTNYVLLELGQPLHAYDLHKVRGATLRVRAAVAGEVLTTLDGERRELEPGMPIIADLEGPVGLAGIMGGADSEIGVETTDVLLEAANFDALAVRRTARALGMHSEASHRFERGADPQMPPVAVDLAASMLAEFAGGRVVTGRIDVRPRPWVPRELSFEVSALAGFAGCDISAEQVVRILGGLDFAPRREGDRIHVTVPSFRVDIEREADLNEEVIRHVGYSSIPSALPVLSTTPGGRRGAWELVDRARSAAVASGLVEVMTWAFIDTESDELAATSPLAPGDPVALANPLAATQGTLRRSLVPGLLAAARDNINRGEGRVELFEQGRVFGLAEGETREAERLAVLMVGVTTEADGFSHLKGVVESIIDGIAYPPIVWSRGGAPLLDESEGAVLTSAAGAVVGCAGRVDARQADRWELCAPVYVAELDLDAALDEPPLPRFEPLPRFPAVVVDMTVEHRDVLEFAELELVVRELAGELVESVDLVSRFTGDGMLGDAIRTTLRLVYRHRERSLTQEEVNADHEALRQQLAERLGVGFG